MQTSPFKRPESVLVVVHTQAGEVLMLNRSHPRGFWQSVTGSLVPGETPRAAACRELSEETGLQECHRLVDMRHSVRFPIIHPWRARYAPGVHYNREHWFILRLPGRRSIRLNPAEHVAARWLPVPVAARLAASWTNRDAILGLTHHSG